MELKVHNIKGKETDKKIKLNKAIFGIEPNDHAIYLDVKQYLANNRKGLHKSKERAEIAGSTRKIKKQKGTGTARAGSIKNPLFRGGGTIFGPRPRSYDQKINKKVKKLARKSALAYKAKNNEILILEDFKLSNPKTSDDVRSAPAIKASLALLRTMPLTLSSLIHFSMISLYSAIDRRLRTFIDLSSRSQVTTAMPLLSIS